MGAPAWQDTAELAIAEAKGGGGFKGMAIEPVGLPKFLAFVAEEWENIEPTTYSPGELPEDDPRYPG